MRIFGVVLVLACLFSSDLSAEPLDPALEKNTTGLEWLQMSMGERMECILFSMYVLTQSGEQINKSPNDYYDAVGEKLRLNPNLYSENVTSILASIVNKPDRG